MGFSKGIEDIPLPPAFWDCWKSGSNVAFFSTGISLFECCPSAVFLSLKRMHNAIYIYIFSICWFTIAPLGQQPAPRKLAQIEPRCHTRSSSFWWSFHAAHLSLQVCIVNPLEKGSRRESSCHAAIRHLERGTRARLSSLFFFHKRKRLLDKADRPKGKDVVDKGDLVGRSLCLSKDWQCVVKGKPRMDWSLILLFFLGLLSISQLPLLEPTLPAGGMIPIFESNLIFRLQVRATGGEDAKSKNVVFPARR